MQVGWKSVILDFMERYFYLICFATYALEHGPGGYQKAFTTWMDEHKELRTMIEEGKDKLEWYRSELRIVGTSELNPVLCFS